MTPQASPLALTADVRGFLDRPLLGVVATVEADGSPLQAMVWFMREGDSVVFNSRVGRRWPANLGRDRRVAFLVGDADGYVELTGRVEIDDDPLRSCDVILALASRYETDPASLRALIERFRTERRITFRLRPERVLVHTE